MPSILARTPYSHSPILFQRLHFRLIVSQAASRNTSGFGFPWNRLGKLYKEKSSIFSRSSVELTAKLSEFKKHGFTNVSVIGICLAFPDVLSEEGEVGGEIDALLTDLKLICLDLDLESSVEGNVDSWYEVCRKIRVFYDLNVEKGKLGELMGRRKSILLEHGEDVLAKMAEYFCRFGVKKEEAALLLLEVPELLNLDLETPLVCVLKLLKDFNLSSEELKNVSHTYGHVLGTNRMANLPHVMKALDLHAWFFNKIINGNHQLFASYVVNNPIEDHDKEFRDGLEKIQLSRTPIHTMGKLNFLHGIGFGENAVTMRILAHLHGTNSELQERFDCLLHSGVEFSKLCKMVRMHPKILNQNPETLEQKVNFLCGEMGSSLDCLDVFPGFLCFDLEKRIKPRFRFHMWLREKGLCTKNYSIASIIATSEKTFVARLSKMHPDAPKHWIERFPHSTPLVS
ncbi:putative Mitochondrial transcription termination factor family protein [Quillaja saponaria]|uniref:Mitochondrial transcription termination factor family protein n=1 Tax=Quillaja saponaria TaxID=32244 RepID=A0AAD7L3R3_QUISA|nr:putative Mitochondrial transcription termination factor family protein [Quillaja saponaria]